MIEALFDIGAIQPKGDFIDEFIENIGDNYKHLLILNFDISKSLEIENVC